MYSSVLQCTPVYSSVLLCTPVYSSVLQCTLVYSSLRRPIDNVTMISEGIQASPFWASNTFSNMHTFSNMLSSSEHIFPKEFEHLRFELQTRFPTCLAAQSTYFLMNSSISVLSFKHFFQPASQLRADISEGIRASQFWASNTFYNMHPFSNMLSSSEHIFPKEFEHLRFELQTLFPTCLAAQSTYFRRNSSISVLSFKHFFQPA